MDELRDCNPRKRREEMPCFGICRNYDGQDEDEFELDDCFCEDSDADHTEEEDVDHAAEEKGCRRRTSVYNRTRNKTRTRAKRLNQCNEKPKSMHIFARVRKVAQMSWSVFIFRNRSYFALTPLVLHPLRMLPNTSSMRCQRIGFLLAQRHDTGSEPVVSSI
ncbi:hypothetical protein U1Q18_044740 [Sarracenia purpurea var. burkii]